MSMSLLELRYRSVLRLLPAGYRARWEDDMVATLLDGLPAGVDPEEVGPGWSEIASVVALAVRLRLDMLHGTRAPRAVLWTDAVRLVAVIGLLAQAAVAGAVLINDAISTGRFGQLVAVPMVAPPWWHLVWDADLAWVAAYLALVLGQRWVARVFAVVALVRPVQGAYRLVDQLAGGWQVGADRILPTVGALLVAIVPVVALLVGFHREAVAPRRAERWLAALPVAAAGTVGVPLLAWQVSHRLYVDQEALYCLGYAVAGVGYLAQARATGRSGGYAGALALALIAPVVLVARGGTLVQYWSLPPGGDRDAAMTLGYLEVGAVVVLAVLFAVLAGRTLRRLPDGPAAVPVPVH